MSHVIAFNNWTDGNIRHKAHSEREVRNKKTRTYWKTCNEMREVIELWKDGGHDKDGLMILSRSHGRLESSSTPLSDEEMKALQFRDEPEVDSEEMETVDTEEMRLAISTLLKAPPVDVSELAFEVGR
jgi:hypothetical protein